MKGLRTRGSTQPLKVLEMILSSVKTNKVPPDGRASVWHRSTKTSFPNLIKSSTKSKNIVRELENILRFFKSLDVKSVKGLRTRSSARPLMALDIVPVSLFNKFEIAPVWIIEEELVQR